MTIQLYDLVGTDTSRPFSPHCWKSKMMFAHLGLDIEAVPTRFTQIGVGAMADVKSVPTIRDGDLVLVDSFEIARHYAGGTALMAGRRVSRLCALSKAGRKCNCIHGLAVGQCSIFTIYWMMKTRNFSAPNVRRCSAKHLKKLPPTANNPCLF